MQNLVAAFHFPGVLLFRLLIIILLFILDKMMVRFRLFVFFFRFLTGLFASLWSGTYCLFIIMTTASMNWWVIIMLLDQSILLDLFQNQCTPYWYFGFLKYHALFFEKPLKLEEKLSISALSKKVTLCLSPFIPKSQKHGVLSQFIARHFSSSLCFIYRLNSSN